MRRLSLLDSTRTELGHGAGDSFAGSSTEHADHPTARWPSDGHHPIQLEDKDLMDNKDKDLMDNFVRDELVRQTELLESIRAAAWWCAVPVIVAVGILALATWAWVTS